MKSASKCVSAVAAILSITSVVTAQSAERAAFVANDGNLQGSVTSFTFNADGSLNLVDFVITGETDSGGFHPGTNAYVIDINPSGEFLAVGHATGNPPAGWPQGRQLTILRVNSDATMNIHGTFQVQPTPLDLLWLDDEHIAVTQTNFGGINRVWVYHFDWETNQLTQKDAELTGGFTSSLALSANGEFLYAGDSSTNAVYAYRVNKGFTLTHVQTQATGMFPLGLGASHNGRWLYAGGGISSGGNAILGLEKNPADGTLAFMPGTPFTSPGASPKQVVVSSDDQYAIAGHGTDATVRTFEINQETGALTATGHMFDVGAQGTLGEIAVLNELLLVPDRTTLGNGVRGLLSFTINPDGSLTQNGTIVDTQGVRPNHVVGWSPAAPTCPGDLDGDGVVDASDLLILLGEWGPCPRSEDCPADLNGDGVVDASDLLILLGAWGDCR